MTRYRKKPVEVDAMQWLGDNEIQIQNWAGSAVFAPADDSTYRSPGDPPDMSAVLFVAANNRWLPMVTGEWIIHDTKGFYPCKPDIFAATYDPVDADGAYDTAPTGQPAIIETDTL